MRRVRFITAAAAVLLTGCLGSGTAEREELPTAASVPLLIYPYSLPESSSETMTPQEREYYPHADSYAYNMLTDTEKKLYDDIVYAAERLISIAESGRSASDEEWLRAYGCVYNQEPQLFYLSPKVSKGNIIYRETDPEVIRKMREETELRAESITDAAKGMSDREKLRCFHDRLIMSDDFDPFDEYSQTIYGGLVTGSVQCEGYAKTMHYLCRRAGIPSMVVTGTNAEGESHAWDIVMAGGEWYNLDCTWDDPVLSVNDPENVRYNYFLVPDSWIHNISHFNVNRKTGGSDIFYFEPPKCSASEYNYFNTEGLVFSDIDSADAAIREILRETALSGKRAAQIKTSSRGVYDEIRNRLADYAIEIRQLCPDVSEVYDNCDSDLLIIEIDLNY